MLLNLPNHGQSFILLQGLYEHLLSLIAECKQNESTASWGQCCLLTAELHHKIMVKIKWDNDTCELRHEWEAKHAGSYIASSQLRVKLIKHCLALCPGFPEPQSPLKRVSLTSLGLWENQTRSRTWHIPATMAGAQKMVTPIVDTLLLYPK